MSSLLAEENVLRNGFQKNAENLKNDFITAAKSNNLKRVQEIITALKEPRVTIGLAAAGLTTESILDHLDTEKGFSALHWSLIHKNLELTNAVLDAGADANIFAKNGQKPLDMMVNRTHAGSLYGSTGQAEALVQGGAVVGANMWEAAEKADAPRATVTFLKDASQGKIQNPDIHTRAYNQMQTALAELEKIGFTAQL